MSMFLQQSDQTSNQEKQAPLSEKERIQDLLKQMEQDERKKKLKSDNDVIDKPFRFEIFDVGEMESEKALTLNNNIEAKSGLESIQATPNERIEQEQLTDHQEINQVDFDFERSFLEKKASNDKLNENVSIENNLDDSIEDKLWNFENVESTEESPDKGLPVIESEIFQSVQEDIPFMIEDNQEETVLEEVSLDREDDTTISLQELLDSISAIDEEITAEVEELQEESKPYTEFKPVIIHNTYYRNLADARIGSDSFDEMILAGESVSGREFIVDQDVTIPMAKEVGQMLFINKAATKEFLLQAKEYAQVGDMEKAKDNYKILCACSMDSSSANYAMLQIRQMENLISYDEAEKLIKIMIENEKVLMETIDKML